MDEPEASQSPRARATAISVRLGAMLAIAGGFLDAYTYVSRGKVFANSQTGNVVLFGVEAARGEWRAGLRHLPPIAAFVVGVAAAETLKRPRVARFVRFPARAALVLEIVVLVIVGALPAATPDFAVTIVIAFVSSVQVSMFRMLGTSQYNSTMTTGNLRTLAQALYVALFDRNRDANREAAVRATSFAIVIGAFLGGAIFGAIITLHIGGRAAWVAAAVLASGLGLFFFDDFSEDRRDGPRALPRTS